MQKQNTSNVSLACIQVKGFSEIFEKLKQFALINGRSNSLITNYGRKLADISLYYNKLPHILSEEELREYLAVLIKKAKSTSQSEFKHTVYGIRFYFKMLGKPVNVSLPIIKDRKRLPAVLSKQEIKLLFQLTKNFKHQLILMFIYSAGLRVGELINLKWSDVDVNRMMLHIKQAKGGKDRYVPLSSFLLHNLIKFVGSAKSKYVFCGGGLHVKMSATGIRFSLRDAVKRACIKKEGVCLHTLRHSYATHLLEDGLDIVSIKELLGHSRIESTLIYLHVANFEKRNKLSPLDSLFQKIGDRENHSHIEKYTSLMSQKTFSEQNSVNQLSFFEMEDFV